MAIGFARCSFIQRSQGLSILMAAAYIGRARLSAPYQSNDYSDRQYLLFPMKTLLPDGAPAEFGDPWLLWSALERAAPRKDASLGIHLTLALPAPDELSASHCLDLVKTFIESFIAPHGLAASHTLHEPSIFVCPDCEFCCLLRFDRLPVRAVAPGKGAMIVYCEPSAGNLSLLGLFESTKDPILLVNSRYCRPPKPRQTTTPH